MLFQMSYPTTLSKIFTFIPNHNIESDEKNHAFHSSAKKEFLVESSTLGKAFSIFLLAFCHSQGYF